MGRGISERPSPARAHALSGVLALALAAAVPIFACAGASRSVERAYVRSGLEGVALRTLDVLVVASGPPRSAGRTLDVQTFEPPELDDRLWVSEEDLATRGALEVAVGKRLRRAGFEIRRIERPTPLLPGAKTRTASTSTASFALLEEDTIRSLAARSDRDALLVIRVVPVDAFSIDVGEGIRTEVTALGRERIRDARPVPHEGRLLVGQVFLFHRATGLRLWTKQLPDFPEGGRLTPGHPFLAYGFVHEPGAERRPAPPSAVRATFAADGFVRSMLADFPAPHAGTDEGRSALASVDAEEEARAQSFFDEEHLALDLGAGWSLERAGLDVELGGEPAPDLVTGDLAPSGTYRIVPRASYFLASGLVLSAAFPFGLAPRSFARTYHRDNPRPTLADPGDRDASLVVDGTTTWGAEIGAGIASPISHGVLLLPSVALFGAVWSTDASPGSVIRESTRGRLGARGGIDLWLRWDEQSPLYGRFGGGARAGLDLGGPLILGLDFSASAGVFL